MSFIKSEKFCAIVWALVLAFGFIVFGIYLSQGRPL